MTERLLLPATEKDVRRLWPAMRSARLFESAEALRDFWSEAPWRVRVTDRGEAVVLERWREHLPILAMKGLWASERRVPELVAQLESVAADQGFPQLLSPLVPEEATTPYRRAGMRSFERVIVMRLERPERHARSAPVVQDGRLRLGTHDDIGALLALDAECFDEFWRYDEPTLDRYVAGERSAVIEMDGRIVGYTLANLLPADVVLGRICVAPSGRGRGLGRILLDDVIGYAARSGASAVTLCTQETNDVSRALYGSAGFRHLPGALEFLLSKDWDEDEE